MKLNIGYILVLAYYIGIIILLEIKRFMVSLDTDMQSTAGAVGTRKQYMSLKQVNDDYV